MLLLPLWALHELAPCLVAACLIMHHCFGPRYVALYPAASPLLKTLLVWLLISSLMLVLFPLPGVLRLCLPLLCLCRLLCLPLIRGGAKVAHLYYCSSAVPLIVALAFALGVVFASAWCLLLVLLGLRTPFETAVHSPQLVGIHFGILPPRCPLFLVLLPQSILTAPTGGPLGCLRGPVVLPLLCLPLGGVLLRRILFTGWGTSCDLPVSSLIPCSLRGIILNFVD